MRRLGLLGVARGAAAAMLAAESPAAEARKGSERSKGSPQDTEWGPRGDRGDHVRGPEWNPDGGLGGRAAGTRGRARHPREPGPQRSHPLGCKPVRRERLLRARHRSALEEGGPGAFRGEAEVAAALATIPPERFAADMKAGVTELGGRVPRKRVAATGFCFGGGMVWLLLTSGERRLAAAAPFYGPFPEGGELSGSRAAVLAVYGGLDTRVNATRDAARAALENAGLEHE